MKIALLDKDQFASLLKYGGILIPEYSYATISDDMPIEDGLRFILQNGNPIEYPSEYIIVEYESGESDTRLSVSSVRKLIATNAEGRQQFMTQFRDDLIVEPGQYAFVFEDYLAVSFKKKQIAKGIIAFRSLCGLSVSDEYTEEVDETFHGISNRIRFRHHYDFPEEERNFPYSLMIGYDRYSPYPRGWAGYYCDVIETYCYHSKPQLGYTESIATTTNVFEKIQELGPDANSATINEFIKDEPFTKRCNEFFTKPGGYLVPYIFYILRDRFRSSDSFNGQRKLIDSMKSVFPEAFDTAATYVGGFFGYDKFYEDYYTSLNLPFLKSKTPTPAPIQAVSQPSEINATPNSEPDKAQLDEQKESIVHEPKLTVLRNTLFANEDDCSDSDFELYVTLFQFIDQNMKKSQNKSILQNGLYSYRSNEEKLQEIEALFKSPILKKEAFKEIFGFKSCPVKELEKLRALYQKMYK